MIATTNLQENKFIYAVDYLAAEWGDHVMNSPLNCAPTLLFEICKFQLET